MYTNGFVLTIDESGVIQALSRQSGREIRLSPRAAYILLDWVVSSSDQRSILESRHDVFFERLNELGFLHSEDDVEALRLPLWQQRWGSLVGALVAGSRNTRYTQGAEGLQAATRASEEKRRTIPKDWRNRSLNCEAYDSHEIALPQLSNLKDDDTIMHILRQRRSCRDFLNVNISCDKLFELIVRVFAPEAWLQPEVGASLPLKSFPSGGSRHELWPLVYVNKVEGLSKGFYAYNDKANSIVRCGNELGEQEGRAILFEQEYLINSALTVFLVADLSHYSWKYYGMNAIFTSWANAGSAAALLSIVSEGLGLGSVITPAINYSVLQDYVRIFDDEICALAISVGAPDRDASTERFSRLLRRDYV